MPLPELLAAVRPFAEQLGQVSITALAARLSTLAPVLDDDLRARAIEVRPGSAGGSSGWKWALDSGFSRTLWEAFRVLRECLGRFAIAAKRSSIRNSGPWLARSTGSQLSRETSSFALEACRQVCALACAPVGDLPALWTPQPTVGAAAAAAWLRAVEADAATVPRGTAYDRVCGTRCSASAVGGCGR